MVLISCNETRFTHCRDLPLHEDQLLNAKYLFNESCKGHKRFKIKFLKDLFTLVQVHLLFSEFESFQCFQCFCSMLHNIQCYNIQEIFFSFMNSLFVCEQQLLFISRRDKTVDRNFFLLLRTIVTDIKLKCILGLVD